MELSITSEWKELTLRTPKPLLAATFAKGKWYELVQQSDVGELAKDRFLPCSWQLATGRLADAFDDSGVMRTIFQISSEFD